MTIAIGQPGSLLFKLSLSLFNLAAIIYVMNQVRKITKYYWGAGPQLIMVEVITQQPSSSDMILFNSITNPVHKRNKSG